MTPFLSLLVTMSMIISFAPNQKGGMVDTFTFFMSLKQSKFNFRLVFQSKKVFYFPV